MTPGIAMLTGVKGLVAPAAQGPLVFGGGADEATGFAEGVGGDATWAAHAESGSVRTSPNAATRANKR